MKTFLCARTFLVEKVPIDIVPIRDNKKTSLIWNWMIWEKDIIALHADNLWGVDC